MLSPFVTENSFLFHSLINLGCIIKDTTTDFLFVNSLSHRMAFNGMPIHTNRIFTSSNCDCIILQH